MRTKSTAMAATMAPYTSSERPGRARSRRTTPRGLTVLHRLQEGDAQGRRQDQRYQDRQRHRADQRDRELPVDHADRAAEEGHRNEYGGQDHGDSDQGSGDLAHGLAGRLLGRQP